MSETPTPPEPERIFPRFPPRHAIKAAVGLLGCRWCFTCLVAAVFLLGSLGWLLTFSILPRFGVVVPLWLKYVSDGVVLVAGVPLIVLSYLLPRQEDNQ
jgi:hypothetical protein